MRTFDEALAASADKPAFSNGTEGLDWMDNWCDRCVHDRSSRLSVAPDPRNGGLVGCALVAVALVQRTPAEWIEQESGPDRYHCVEFRNEDDEPGDPEPEPGPPPVDPGQLDLVDLVMDDVLAELTPNVEMAGAR